MFSYQITIYTIVKYIDDNVYHILFHIILNRIYNIYYNYYIVIKNYYLILNNKKINR